ncbi:MAG: sugar transferase, partial [Eubacteriales bacterium]
YDNGKRTYVTPKVSDIIIRSGENLHVFDTPLLLCRNTGLTFEQKVLKRIVDILLSLIALVLTSPFMLITAIAIKAYDKGPVFYKQARVTKDGKVFDIIKFRSMIPNAEADGKSRPAVSDDERITPIGKVIRAIRFDEMPQIFNILKGDMSIVGPRPERVEHVEKYTKEMPEFAYRLKVKAGLTGYAQVYGKYNTTSYDKLKLDLFYIENYSLRTDIRLIFMTVKVLFMKESTEGFDKADDNSASGAPQS